MKPMQCYDIDDVCVQRSAPVLGRSKFRQLNALDFSDSPLALDAAAPGGWARSAKRVLDD